MLDEVLLDVPHHPQCELGREDAGVLRLILFQDVCLDRATHPLQRVSLDALVHLWLQNLVAADSE